jgi:hypothetical protein
MDDRQAAALAGRAGLELELTSDAFDRLRAGAIEEWTQTSPGHVEKREKLWIVVSTLDAVRGALKRMVADGELANAAIALAEQNLLRP